MNPLIPPSSNFRAVRDGRNAQVYYYDIDLTTARSAKAGTGLVLPISGNSFFCNPDPSDGYGFVHFQDTNFDSAPAPIYVSPGSIFKIPFTQILIENVAQIGKKLRIVYGVDIDFQPGSVAQQSISGSISTIEAVYGKSALSQAFTAVGSGAANAGVFPSCGVFNNSSNKILYCDSVLIASGSAAVAQHNIRGVTSCGNMSALALGINKYIGGPLSSGQGYGSTVATSNSPVYGVYATALVPVTGSIEVKFTSPILVPPGCGIVVESANTNHTNSVYFQYTEN